MHQSLFSIYKKLWNLSLILNFDRMGLAIISSNGSAVLFAMGIIAQVPAAHRVLSKTTTPWEAAAVAEDEAALITTGTAADRRHLQPPGGANQIWKSTVHQVKPNSFFFWSAASFWRGKKKTIVARVKKKPFDWFVLVVSKPDCTRYIRLLGKSVTSWRIRMEDAPGIRGSNRVRSSSGHCVQCFLNL